MDPVWGSDDEAQAVGLSRGQFFISLTKIAYQVSLNFNSNMGERDLQVLNSLIVHDF